MCDRSEILPGTITADVVYWIDRQPATTRMGELISLTSCAFRRYLVTNISKVFRQLNQTAITVYIRRFNLDGAVYASF